MPHQAKIVVIEQVYHQMSGASPVLAECKYSRQLTSDEQPYSRITKVGEQQAPLDMGWLDRIELSTMFIKNLENGDDATKILEMSVAESEAPFAVVPPGESLRFCPAPGARFRLRSLSGEIRFLVNLFPR